MLIGVISDTHDNMNALKKAVDYFIERQISLVLHAGDFVAPFTAREFRRLNCKLIGVFGNNDGDKLLLTKRYSGFGELHEGIHQLELDGKMIVMTHYPDIAQTLGSRGAYDVVICGHTHRPEIREGKPLMINPGECCGWLEGVSTIAVLDVELMRVELIKL
jgi:putative phosphoesterase